MILPKAGMAEIYTKMMARYRLAAPAMRPSSKVVEFLEITDAGEVIMDDRITYKSPKEFFFPQYEKLMTFVRCSADLPDESTTLVPDFEREERGLIIFGVRPCDLTALGIVTKVLTQGKFTDPYFATRLENSIIIGVGCREKKTGCFCELLTLDKSYSENCDLFLEDMEDSYRVQYVSDKGKEKLAEFIPGLEADAPAPTDLQPFFFLPSKEKNIEAKNIFDNVNWGQVAEICQGCGLCSFVCPTCHCFDFKDVEQNGAFCRYRTWDSCMNPKFTLHASGHNPRESKTERFRQRVLHKYLYFPQNVGETACTGCGRCIRSCPAGMNFKQIIEGIMEELI